jgi:hypothetical protein
MRDFFKTELGIYRLIQKERFVSSKYKKLFQDWVFSENDRYNEEQNQTLPRLSAGPLPEKEHVLKFQLVDYLDDENLIDYLIVYGDEINSLIVQSYAKPAKSKSGISNQTYVLIDAMAAFCRLKSAGDLHKVTTFRSKQNVSKMKF